jgi:hypothetical protein
VTQKGEEVTDSKKGPKTKVLKVMRNLGGSKYESFEFEQLPQASGFDVLSLSELNTELWNI